MIKRFRNKELANLWEGASTKIDSRFHTRILERLDALDTAIRAEDMNIPGFDFHQLRSFDPTRFTIHVNGPWRITPTTAIKLGKLCGNGSRLWMNMQAAYDL
jgi:proteic killer suppression protein